MEKASGKQEANERLQLSDFVEEKIDEKNETDFYRLNKAKLEKEECITPVIHICQFKRLLDDNEGGLKIKGTFIVYTFEKKQMDRKDKGALGFEYRINGMTQPAESIQLRHKKIVWESSSSESCATRSIIDVLLPLEMTSIFQKYPFTIYKAEVLILLATIIHGKVTFRPDIAISTNDLSQNVTVAPLNELDHSKNYDFITTCPSVKYFIDKNNCNALSVDFLLIDDGMQKFYKFCFPLFLVCIISTVNAVTEETDYLGTSSAMALTVVVLLPEVAVSTTNQFHLSCNAVNVLLICLGLALASIPPSIEYYPLYFPFNTIGIFSLWLSFGLAIHNYCSYCMIRSKIIGLCCRKNNYTGVDKFPIQDLFATASIGGKFVSSFDEIFQLPNNKAVEEEENIQEEGNEIIEINESIEQETTKEKNTVEREETNSFARSVINAFSSYSMYYPFSSRRDDCEMMQKFKAGSLFRHSSAVKETSYVPSFIFFCYIVILLFILEKIFNSDVKIYNKTCAN